MSLVTYHGPIDERTVDPDDEFLKEITLRSSPEYWLRGSGDSCLEIDGMDERMIFFYDEPFGFLILRHPDYLVPYHECGDFEVVEHRVGGEPMRIPSCCYVGRAEAYEILLYFAREKEVPPHVNWVDLYEIDFEHGF